MAYKEEIIIDVIEKGLDAANAKLKDFKSNTESSTSANKNLGNSILENGGAMGLLNDATGGLAMTIKDGVEATALFAKGSAISSAVTKAYSSTVLFFESAIASSSVATKVATAIQKGYNVTVAFGASALKLFRTALMSTGIPGLILVLVLLVANFEKVKNALTSLSVPLKQLGVFLGGLYDDFTDLIGVTSDATRELDKMVAKSKESIERNQHFLDANGDQYDQYTRKKIQANIDFNKKVVELNQQFEDKEITSKKELDSKIAEFSNKRNREILGADKDRNEEQAKKSKEASDKLADIAKAAKDKKEVADAKDADKEKSRLEGIAKIKEDYVNKLQDLNAKTEEQKRDIEEQRALKELENLNATESQKQAVRDYYNRLSYEAYNASISEKAELDRNRTDAERQLVLDQKAWKVENGEDGLTKLKNEKALLEEQGKFDLEKLQYIIDTAKAESKAKIDAEIAYKKRKQENDNEIKDNVIKQKKEITRVEQEAAKTKKDILIGTYAIAKDGVAILSGLAGENKELQKGALLATSALSIAEIIAGTNVGATKEVASKGIFGLSTGTILYAKMGISIASVLAATAKGLEGINASGGASGSSGGGGGSAPPAPPPAPSFNLVQGTGANQIAQAVASQNTPIEAYVVTSNVSTGQALDRSIIKNSKF